MWWRICDFLPFRLYKLICFTLKQSWNSDPMPSLKNERKNNQNTQIPEAITDMQSTCPSLDVWQIWKFSKKQEEISPNFWIKNQCRSWPCFGWTLHSGQGEEEFFVWIVIVQLFWNLNRRLDTITLGCRESCHQVVDLRVFICKIILIDKGCPPAPKV